MRTLIYLICLYFILGLYKLDIIKYLKFYTKMNYLERGLLIFYSTQFKFFCDHSIKVPTVKSLKNNKVLLVQMVKFLKFELNKRGKRIINSISKIKKTMAIRKKCKEREVRVDIAGINPHSKGLSFSLSCVVLILLTNMSK